MGKRISIIPLEQLTKKWEQLSGHSANLILLNQQTLKGKLLALNEGIITLEISIRKKTIIPVSEIFQIQLDSTTHW